MKTLEMTIKIVVTDQYYLDEIAEVEQDILANKFQEDIMLAVGVEECTATFKELEQDI